MKMNKIIACVFAGIVFGFAAFAQEKETTVESEYMSDDAIIAELISEGGYESKEMALTMIREAVDNGKASRETVYALENLAGEGINTQSRVGRRVSNNYTLLRKDACVVLGKVGTPEAAQTLNKIVSSDNETMVLAAAIHSLGEIGYNDNDETTNTIAHYTNKVNVLNPVGNSSLALEVVNAYAKLASNTKDIKPVVNSLQKIATNPYYTSNVQKRAWEVIKKLRSGETDSSKGK